MSKESEISVFASALCWSAEPLKVALRVKNDFTSVCHYIFLWMNQRFECVVEWTFKDSIKDSLLPPSCGETMKLHWLTRTRRWNINRRSLYIYNDFIVKFVFCYVDRYFIIVFCILHFWFQRDLVSVSGLHIQVLLKKWEYREKGQYFFSLISEKVKPIYYIDSLHIEWNSLSLFFLKFWWLWLMNS